MAATALCTECGILAESVTQDESLKIAAKHRKQHGPSHSTVTSWDGK